MKTFTFLITVFCLLSALMLHAQNGQSVESETAAVKIAQCLVLGSPLKATGDDPSPAGSDELFEILNNLKAVGGAETRLQLEDFIEQQPSSPWIPSIRANLAVVYRAAGRYSLALQHWEAAWEKVRNAASGNEKSIGDFVLANWIRLLCNLGRAEKLEEVLNSVGRRDLENHAWQVRFNNAWSTLKMMRDNPGISFRCGTLSLYSVGLAQGQPAPSLDSLMNIPSPGTGFSMTRLLELANTFKLGLVAVKRTPHSNIPVPSVVHWKENHYAAIVKETNGQYLVIDPTFGEGKVLTASVIEDEASGYFLVPSTSADPDWLNVSTKELATVFGKGVDNAPPLRQTPPCPEEGQTCSCRIGGPGGSGPGGSGPGPGGCGPCKRPGMPTWEVAEPHVSLWIHDKPMVYHTSKGTEVALRFTYNVDESRPDNTNIFNFGPLWNCNWMSYIDVGDPFTPFMSGWPFDPTFPNFEALCYGAAGGVRRFFAWDTLIVTNQYEDRVEFEKLDDGTKLTGAKLHYPNGSVWTYDIVQFISDGYTPLRRLFLRQQADAQGRTTTFHYNTNTSKVYLTHVVDTDGRTNSFGYNTNSAVPAQVLYVTNVFGSLVSLKYSSSRQLTNIVDVVGISSSFAYQVTNSINLLTNYTTPYGSTAFEYLAPLADLFGTTSSDDINRAIRVTQPNAAKHIYMYRDHTPDSPARTDGPYIRLDQE